MCLKRLKKPLKENDMSQILSKLQDKALAEIWRRYYKDRLKNGEPDAYEDFNAMDLAQDIIEFYKNS